MKSRSNEIEVRCDGVPVSALDRGNSQLSPMLDSELCCGCHNDESTNMNGMWKLV